MPVTNAGIAGELEKLADLLGVLDIWVLKVTREWKKAWGIDAGCGQRILSGRKVDWGVRVVALVLRVEEQLGGETIRSVELWRADGSTSIADPVALGLRLADAKATLARLQAVNRHRSGTPAETEVTS